MRRRSGRRVGCYLAARPSLQQSAEGPEPSRLESSDPMREAGATSTGGLLAARYIEGAHPTGDSYSRTTDAPAQRFNDANLKATLEVGQEKSGQGQYKGRSPCVRMYGAPATSAGTPRRLRAQEPRPGRLYSDTRLAGRKGR